MPRKPTREPKRLQAIEPRKDGRVVKRTTIYLDETLARRLAHFCIDAGKDMSTVISEALEKYLPKR